MNFLINIKKALPFVLLLMLCILFSALTSKHTMTVDNHFSSERFNDGKALRATRAVSALSDVNEVAVLNRKNHIIVGIITNSDASISDTKNQALQIVSSIFDNKSDIRIALNSDRALDVIELSYFIESDMPKRALISRFNFLRQAINSEL